MTYPDLRDFLAIAGQHESLTQEIQVIASASPYAADLDQVPQVKTGISTLLENVWVDVTTASGLITVEIETAPSVWTAATLVESASPAANQVYFQLVNSTTFPFSPRMIFNSAHAGQRVRTSYEGWGSVPLAKYMITLWSQLEQALNALPPRLVSDETYNYGRLDGGGVASTSCYVTSSQQELIGEDFSQGIFDTDTEADFSTGGNCEVAIFTNADYWRRIIVALDYNGSSWSFETVESAEASSQGGLTTPDLPLQFIPVGIVDVQNDGNTSAAGHVLAIPSSQVTPVSVGKQATIHRHDFEYYGALVADEEVCVPFFPGYAGELRGVTILIQDSGTSGSTIVDVLLADSGDPTGTTMFTGAAKATIASDSGNVGTVKVTGSDLTNVTFTASQWIRIKFTSTVAVSAENLKGSLIYATDIEG